MRGKRLEKSLLGLFIGLFVFISIPFLPSAQASDIVSIGRTNSGDVVELRMGQLLKIRLKENPSTGYGWKFSVLDKNILKNTGHSSADMNSGGTGAKLIGAPVISTWTLKPLKTGRTLVKMDYYRHWEGEAGILDRFWITVNIRP